MWLRKHRPPMQSIDTVESGRVDVLAQAKYANEQTRQTVHDALEELPESQRTVLTLHYLGGMTAREIARFMGTSHGAILDRLYRARLQLRKELIPMMRQTLGASQLPPSFTTQMMNRIDQLRPIATPASKPLMPWVAAAATLIIAIFIGLGQQSTTRTQRPYSLDATESSVQVELIDAPAFYRSETKPAPISRSGRLNSKNEKNGVQPESVALGPTSTVAKENEFNDTEWSQTHGPYGGDVTTLFRASDGTLYAATGSPGIFRSDTNGDTWVAVTDSLDVYGDGSLPYVSTIAEGDGVIYLKAYRFFFYSDTRGESWHWVKFPDQFETSPAFAVSGGRIYVGLKNEGVVYSDDYGKSWTPFSNAFPTGLPEQLMTAMDQSLSIEPPDELLTVGKSLFAKRGDNLYRLKSGEESWMKIVGLKDLRFFTVVQGALIIGNRTDLRRSTDGGDNWAPLAGNIRLWSRENKRVKVDIPWSRVQTELENRSLSIVGITEIGNTVYILLSDGSLIRSTENGMWVTKETELNGLEPWEMNKMAALSKHALCIATKAGLFRWTDGNNSWRQINKGIMNTYVYDLVSYKNALYATTGYAILKSVDGGKRWETIHQGLPMPKGRAFAISKSELYLGLEETNYRWRDKPFTAGIFRLSEDQKSWIPVQTEMRTDDIDHPKKNLYPKFERLNSVDELVISGDTFYAIAQIGEGHRLFRWRKGEHYWTSISPDVEPHLIHFNTNWKNLAVSGKTIYFDLDGNLMYSRNEGNTWSRIDTVPGHNESSRQIEWVDIIGNTAYISVSDLGVFRSTNHGETWESVSDGLPQSHSWGLYAVGNTLFAADWEASILQLTNGQNRWTFVNSHPPIDPSVGLNAMEVVDSTLYVATGGWGVYRINMEQPESD